MEKAKQIPKRLGFGKTAGIYIVLIILVGCTLYFTTLKPAVEHMAIFPFSDWAKVFSIALAIGTVIIGPLAIGLDRMNREKQPTEDIKGAVDNLNATVAGMNTTLGMLQTSTEGIVKHAADEKVREERIIAGQNNLSSYVEQLPTILNHLSEIKKLLGVSVEPEAEAKAE